jgi:thioredoxin reductase/CxxC motif-containing protein
MKNIKKKYRSVIIGSGPAGLAAALRFCNEGMNDFLLLERDAETGGILNQCIHNGFGLKFFGKDLTGPEFVRKLEALLPPSADILTGAMVSAVNAEKGGGFSIKIHSLSHGLLVIKAETVITATGCRERTRENIEVPGTRPAGVFTAGQAQTLINRRHYSIGRQVVIQGSGDIGLIMARRLTIEGFKVLAVFERLPYLSGSIRNKVQCLDHFEINLHLGRQITNIQGRDRLTAVETLAVDEDFQIVPGSGLNFKCDTALFAAGLIPELETVKPAGISLSDSFHADINSGFETSVQGLFSAGNCLHINDLADSAAEEGISAADSVLKYLKNNVLFRASVRKNKPFFDPEPNKKIDSSFFEKLIRENLTVCIVCPTGCLLKEGNFGCRRGEEYFRRLQSPEGSYRQRVSTTVEVPGPTEGEMQIIPAVSEEEIPAALISEAVSTIKETGISLGRDDNRIEIPSGGQTFIFNLCRPGGE